MATKLVEIGNLRRNQLAVIGEYRTTDVDGNRYDTSHPYVKSADENPNKYGKTPVNPNDNDNYGKVGDDRDVQARIGIDSPGALQKNKYFRLGNQYDIGDVLPLPK